MSEELNLDKTDWTPVTFGDVVAEVRTSTKDPVGDGIERVVGLEHIEPECIHLRSWAPIEDGTTFTKVFRKGHVLFGRRRAYLKKAALANFNGICSGDITVMEAKNGLNQELLPFLVNNDKFFDYAVQHSAGGLSPRTKFKEIANYEFLLPPPDQQDKLIELLQAADSSIIRYAEVEAAAQELHRSWINETVGNLSERHGVKLQPMSEVCDRITYGFTNPMPTVDHGPYMVTATNVKEGKIDFEEARKTTVEAFNDLLTPKSRPVKGDVLLTKDGRLGELAIVGDEQICINQSVALIRAKSALLPEFLVTILSSPRFQSEMIAGAGGTTIKHIYITKVAKMIIPVPKKSTQREITERDREISAQSKAASQALYSSKQLLKGIVSQIF